MIQALFKSMENSELVREAVYSRIATIVEKFPDLQYSRVSVTLEMENSPHKPGPDLFTVKLHIPRGKYAGVTVSKSDPNLCVALAEVAEHMLATLNRRGDRRRVKSRNQSRHWLAQWGT